MSASSASRHEYRVYTKKFDLTVHAENLDRLNPDPWKGGEALVRREALDRLEDCISNALEHYEAASIATVSRLQQRVHENVIVSLLVDHSNSLRGESLSLAAVSIGIVSECLAHLSIAHEILGFTTSTWHGGGAKKSWEMEGRRENPGRLCDLLHIIYRGHTETGPVPMQTLAQIFRPALLKENVDGEAVEWAVGRLRKTPFARKILIVVSDGAPVDDTTLLSNWPEILDEHLCDTIHAINASGDIEVYGVGLAHHMTRYYSTYCMIETPKDIGAILLPFIGDILSEAPPSRPAITAETS